VRSRPKAGQADLVAAWLGTYQLLTEGVRDTQRWVKVGDRVSVPIDLAMPSADTIALAATQIVAMADLEGQPWFGSAGVRGPIGDE
jgi:hypothetical protein